jgi:bifunctional DNA-binding transcriptional regulator/antitoxin component of YhaV-PrlF toxin-antitoxin module
MIVNQEQMAKLTEGLPTKSEKMRVLARAGYKRSDIARFLGSRYQFVRNVLLREEERSAERPQVSANAASSEQLGPTKLRLSADGSVRIPAPFCDALGLKEGDALIASLDEGGINLLTIPAAVRKAQAIVRRFVPEGVSLVDELLEDRRREVERERQDG